MGFCTLIYVCFTVSEVGWEREHRALEEGFVISAFEKNMGAVRQ